MNYLQIAIAAAIGNVLVGLGVGSWPNGVLALCVGAAVAWEYRSQAIVESPESLARARNEAARAAERRASRRGGL